MNLTQRLLVTLPFVAACVLNLLSVATYRLHWNRQDIAVLGFLFAAPWAPLIDALFVNLHNRWLAVIYGYTVMLWVPAALYSACLWLLLSGIQIFAARLKRSR